MSEELVSHEPATGAELWRGRTSDVDAEVAAARAAWPGWAARPFAYRAETLRRFVDRVQDEAEGFADLIARETGKPLWEARTAARPEQRRDGAECVRSCRTRRTPQSLNKKKH